MTKLGNSQYALSPGGASTQTIVTAGANTNGIILRTLSLYGANASVQVRHGGNSFFYSSGNQDAIFWAGELFLPPGQALDWQAGGASQTLVASYDLL